MFKAYCDRTGRIEFTKGKLPSGMLPIAAGIERQVRELIVATSRHGYTEDLFLVPGVPEAEDDDKALDALLAYTGWIAEGRRDKPMMFGSAIR